MVAYFSCIIYGQYRKQAIFFIKKMCPNSEIWKINTVYILESNFDLFDKFFLWIDLNGAKCVRKSSYKFVVWIFKFYKQGMAS